MSALADSAARQIVVGEHESLARQAVRRFLRHRLANPQFGQQDAAQFGEAGVAVDGPALVTVTV